MREIIGTILVSIPFALLINETWATSYGVKDFLLRWTGVIPLSILYAVGLVLLI